MPKGMVWNMIYDENAPEGFLPSITHDELWRRLEAFLNEVVPVAEAAGVKLAAHPDDPPMPTVRAQPRLVFQPRHYQKLLDLNPSPANSLEFCIGSLAEMTEGDIYETVDTYSRQQRLGYIHFRRLPDPRRAVVAAAGHEGPSGLKLMFRVIRRRLPDLGAAGVPDARGPVVASAHDAVRGSAEADVVDA